MTATPTKTKTKPKIKNRYSLLDTAIPSSTVSRDSSSSLLAIPPSPQQQIINNHGNHKHNRKHQRKQQNGFERFHVCSKNYRNRTDHYCASTFDFSFFG